METGDLSEANLWGRETKALRIEDRFMSMGIFDSMDDLKAGSSMSLHL